MSLPHVSALMLTAALCRRSVYLPWQNVHGPYQAPLGWSGDVLRGMLAATDAALGNMITTLKDKGMWANTV